jgi:polynucleotide 5'-hydroxyl-kinase GRC3/NOL9
MGGRYPAEHEVLIAPEWEEIARASQPGLILVIGGADTGKSTFARWLFRRLANPSVVPSSFLDGDPGQSTLGPPTTVTLVSARPGAKSFPGGGRRWRRFVGATNPRGHVLHLLAAIARLVQLARSRRVGTIVYDTTGLIDPGGGGVALKLAKIDLLRPEAVIAIRRGAELKPLLARLRTRVRPRLWEIDASPARRSWSRLARQRYRMHCFAEHFAAARAIEVDMSRFGLFPARLPVCNQLLAFEDAGGYTLALGIALRADKSTHRATILTPISDLARARAVRLGDLKVEPATFRDSPC